MRETDKLNESLARKEQAACRRLLDLHGQCELNFLMLERVFPDMRLGLRAILLAGDSRSSTRLEIEVVKRAPYTTHLALHGTLCQVPMAGELQADIHMYHDARMAEVTHSSANRLINLRNKYPNALMLQPDEKWQANHLVGVWLDYFIKHGRRAGNNPGQPG